MSPYTTVLIAAAMEEIGATIHRLQLNPADPYYVGTVNDQRIVAAVAGIGAGSACRLLEQLLAAYHPDHVVHLGFAGGLDSQLAPGDVLHIARVASASGGDIAVNSSHNGCTLLTLDRPVHGANEKAHWHKTCGAVAVDMESYPLALLAQQRGVRLTIVRAICDPADMHLPKRAADWVRADGTADVVAVVRYLLVHPWQLPTLLQLRRNARLAARTVAEHVEAMLRYNVDDGPWRL